MNTSWCSGIRALPLLLGCLVAPVHAQEIPLCEGKPASWWIEQLEVRGNHASEEAEGALIELGLAAVPGLLGLLESPKWERRYLAVWLLGEIRPPQESVVAALASALEDREARVSSTAARALGRIGPPAGPAVPSLVARLAGDLESHEDPIVEALAGIGERCVPAVVAALPDGSGRECGRALEVLQRLGPRAASAMPALLKLLRSGASEVRPKVIRVLSRFGAVAVSDLLGLLEQGDAETRRNCVEALGGIVPEQKQVIPVLIPWFQDPDPWLRLEVAKSVAWIDRNGSPGIRFLVDLYRSGPELIRPAAVHWLAELRPCPEELIRVFCEALRDRDPRIGRIAVDKLSDWRDSAEAARALFEALGDERLDSEIRGRIWTTLQGMRKALLVLLPDLLDLIRGPKTPLRLMALQVLPYTDAGSGKIAADVVPFLSSTIAEERWAALHCLAAAGKGGEAAVPALVGMLRAEDRELRVAALRALGGIGSADRGALSAIVPFLQDREVSRLAMHALFRGGPPGVEVLNAEIGRSDGAVRQRIAWNMGLIREYPAEVTPILVRLLDDESEEARRSAIDSIGLQGPAAEAAVPAVMRALDSTNSILRSSAVVALGRIGLTAAPATAGLARLLQDHAGDVAQAAAVALGRIGSAARSAVPDLLQALQDSKRTDLAAAAARALSRIASDDPAVLSGLVAALGSDRYVGSAASEAISRLGPHTVRALPTLLEQVRSQRDVRVLRGIVEALGEIGPPARAAVSALQRKLRWRDALLRSSLEWALARIRGEDVPRPRGSDED